MKNRASMSSQFNSLAYRCGWFGWCCALATSTWAYDMTDSFHINPFISQAAIHTSNNNFLGQSDDSTSIDSRELGVVLNYAPLQELNFSAQVMSREAGGMDNGHVRAEYYFANYTFLRTADYSSSFKVGRLRLPYGLYNDTRDVAATNPSIILPQSIYVDEGRNTFFAAPGAMLHNDFFWNDNSVALDVGYTKIEPDNNEMTDLAKLPTQGGSKGTYNPMGRLMLSFDNDTYKIGFSYRESRFEYSPSIAGLDISTGTLASRAKLLSLQYNTSNWSLTAEWGRADTSASFDIERMYVNPPGMWVPLNQAANFSFPAESYYLQGEYRLTPKFTLLARHDEFYANRDDRHGEAFAATINQMAGLMPQLSVMIRPAYSQYTIDNTLGVTWNISQQMLARLEWHNVEGTFWLSSTDNASVANSKKYWDIVAAEFAYRF